MLLLRALGLRWLRFKGFDLSALAAIAIVVLAWRRALPAVVLDIPLWLGALTLAGAAVLGRALADRAISAKRPAARETAVARSQDVARARLPEPPQTRRWLLLVLGLTAAGATCAIELVGGISNLGHIGLSCAGVVSAYGLGIAAGIRRLRVSWFQFALLAGVLALWAVLDLSILRDGLHLYDTHVYFGSAARWMDGGSAYMTAPIAHLPSRAVDDFFLYPPPLLPFFALLSRLPNWLGYSAWVVLLVSAAVSAFRLLGMRWTWCLALMAFPPLVKGVESGNATSLTFLLYAAGARAGGFLVLNGLFKTQSGLPALSLLRERNWRRLILGMAAVIVICLATLPIVGLESWRAWFDSLGFRATSQVRLPILYGDSIARDVPAWAFVAVSVVCVGVALMLLRGRRALAGLGLATIVASPSLWLHGFVFAIPAVLTLESGVLLWGLLGVAGLGPGYWWLVIVGTVALLASSSPAQEDDLHPLAGTDGPWPEAPPIAQSASRTLGSASR